MIKLKRMISGVAAIMLVCSMMLNTGIWSVSAAEPEPSESTGPAGQQPAPTTTGAATPEGTTTALQEEPAPKVSIYFQGAGGTVYDAAGNPVPEDGKWDGPDGSEATFRLVPATGYQIMALTVNGETVCVDENGWFTVTVAEDLQISFSCADLQPPEIKVGRVTQGWAKQAQYIATVEDNTPEGLIVTLRPEGEKTVVLTQQPDGSYAFTVKRNGKYTVTATDTAGREGIYVINETFLDSDGPAIGSFQRHTESWSKEATYVFTVEDACGVEAVTLHYAGHRSTLEPAADGITYSFTLQNNMPFTVKAIDALANTSEASAEETKIDQTVPVVSAATRQDDKWSLTATYQLTAKDSEAGIQSVTVFCGAESIPVQQDKETYTFQVTADGVYTVTVMDGAGNKVQQTVVEERIDTTAPTISGVSRDPSTWSQTSTYSFKVMDGESQIKSVVVTDGKKETELTGKDGIYTFQAQRNQNYKIIATDRAGNLARIVVTENQIDLTAPVFHDIQTQTTWDAQKNITVLTLSDDKQLASLSCTDSSGKAVAVIPLGGKNYQITATKNGIYTVTATDKAGNVAQSSFAVTYIDEKAPRLNKLESSVPDKWTNTDVTLSVQGEDAQSGIAGYWYCPMDVPFDKDVWKPMTILGSIGTVTLTEDQENTYYVVAQDKVGHISQPMKIVVKIDKTAPAPASIAPETPTGTDGWYTKMPTYSINKASQGQHLAPVNYIIQYKYNGVEQREIRYNGSNAPVIDKDGEWEITIVAVDEAGNRATAASSTAKFKIDTKTPDAFDVMVNGASVMNSGIENKNWNQINSAFWVTKATYSVFENSTITVTAKAQGGGSGMAGLYYQVAENGAAYNVAGKWTALPDAGFTLEPDRFCIVYIKAVDGAGNTTYFGSKGIILDSKAPDGPSGGGFTLNVNRANISKHGIYYGDVKVDVALVEPMANDTFSGIKTVTYRVLRDGVVSQSGQLYPGNGSTKSDGDRITAWSGSLTVMAKNNNSNHVVVEVTAIDQAGNRRTSTVKDGVIRIDLTKPEITACYENNKSTGVHNKVHGFTGRRTLTLSVKERNFVAEESIITVMETDSGKISEYKWASAGDIHTAVIPITKDGHYTVAVKVTDAAGNSNSVPIFGEGTVAGDEFILDNTRPAITVSYNNNSLKNDQYFAADRTITVTVQERNFNPYAINVKVDVTKEDGKQEKVAITTWERKGNTYTMVIPCTLEGVYEVDVTGQDAVGNYSGAAVYQGEATQKWVLDKHLDAPVFSGVVPGGAYKQSLAPSVAAMDKNIDTATIRLYKADTDGNFVDVSDTMLGDSTKFTTIEGGMEATLDIFHKEQRYDGVYAVEIDAIDLAGNTASSRIVFSVNRFGSIYVYSDFLTDLIGQYRTNIEQDLIITEYNPSGYVDGSAQVYITRDGTMLSEPAYTLENAPAQLESQWHTNTYVIARDNFAADGVYEVVISTEDLAGNIPENTAQEQQIRFAVDTTAPELSSVVGMEESIIKANSQAVSITAMDNIGLSKVEVYVDGEILESWSFQEGYSADLSFTIPSGLEQHIRIVLTDLAGNVLDTDSEDFTPGYTFRRTITVSTNLLLRYYANKPLFFSSLGAVGAGSLGIALVLLNKKKKNPTKK